MADLSDVMLMHDDHDHDDTEGVLLAKGVCMIVLFCACMICGIIPLLLAKKFNWLSPGEARDLRTSNRAVMTLLSFGGGVLMSTTFMHLIPEIEENVAHLQYHGDLNTFSFSLTPLLTCSGFFIMYLVEELVHLYIHHRERKNGKASPLVRNLSVRESRGGSITAKGEKNNVTISTAELVETDKDAENCNHNHHHNAHSHLPENVGDDVSSALRGLLIVLALSIHELFEGLAVGLESSTSSVWYMLGAIAAHKLVIAFCISVELIATNTKFWLTIIYIVTYAIVSPLGIGIGMLLVGGAGATAAGLPSVLLQGLASGTLLYVIFFEIWKGDRSGILQFAGSLFGFFLMFGLKLLTPHSHSHGHSHGGSIEEEDHAHSK